MLPVLSRASTAAVVALVAAPVAGFGTAAVVALRPRLPLQQPFPPMQLRHACRVWLQQLRKPLGMLGAARAASLGHSQSAALVPTSVGEPCQWARVRNALRARLEHNQPAVLRAALVLPRLQGRRWARRALPASTGIPQLVGMVCAALVRQVAPQPLASIGAPPAAHCGAGEQSAVMHTPHPGPLSADG